MGAPGETTFLPFQTKLAMPRRRADTLARPRIGDLLRDHIDRHLHLIIAPAGYGKTTLLVDFIHESELTTAYMRLDAGDRDLRTFLTYLIHAVRTVYPAFGAHSLGALGHAANLAAELPSLIGVLTSELDRHVDALTLLVLDDYHAVNDSDDVNRAVDLFLTYLPQQLRLIVAGRRVPRLSLTRLVVQQDVFELSASHLCFTPEEVAQFVRSAYHVTLTDAAVEDLTNRVQGWIAGIILSLHRQGAATSLALAGVFARSDVESQVFAPLASQLLADEEPDLRDFLLGSAVLSEMTPAACDRLLERSDSARVLAELNAIGLFTDRIEAAEPTYLYHDLFRRFLLDQLERTAPERLRALHQAAGDLRRGVGAWLEAVDHYLVAGAIDAAADVLEDAGTDAFEHAPAGGSTSSCGACPHR